MTPDLEAATSFLKLHAPAGPWVLTAIEVDKEGIDTRTFQPAEETYCLGWLAGMARRNIYFHVNTPTGVLTKKADRKDIKSVDWLHIDIDPRADEDLDAERKRAHALLTTNLPKGIPKPTCIIFSGGGYQAFWRLKDPIEIGGVLELAEDAKLYNVELEARFEADQCHNIDRIMRLPGTVNWPGERKRDKGRKPALATLEEFNDLAYDLGAFKKAEAAAAATPTEETAGPVDLKNFDPKTVAIIKLGTDPDNPTRWDSDRSDGVWFVACEMARAGFKGGQIMTVLLDTRHGISAHVLEQKNSVSYAGRQANRAIEQANIEFTVDPTTKKPGKGQRNIRVAIRKLGVSLSYDEFAGKSLIKGLDDHEGVLQDDAVMVLRLLIDEKHKFLPEKTFFMDVVKAYALQNRFDPVLDYLDGLTWDGTPRIDKWLITYGKAEDSKYTRAVGPLMLIAGVRRARQPGCKFDEMLVLVSEQGLNKSSAILALVPSQDLFTDALPLNANSKEVIEQLAGIWIAEFAELHGKTTAGIEHVKAFQSRQVDKARAAYGRLAEIVPRRCIFFGTTNTLKFMNDPTGGRRFWPVQVKLFDLKALRRDRDQLWAEAAHREAAKESIRLDPALYGTAKVEQDKSTADNPFTPMLGKVLADVEGKLHSADAWTILNIPADRRPQAHCDAIGTAMRSLGWTYKKMRISGKLEWCYVKGNAKFPKQIEINKDRNGQWYAGEREHAPKETLKERAARLNREMVANDAAIAAAAQGNGDMTDDIPF